MARVVLAMSGGVDSSVAASLLRTAGHEVIGVFMRHGLTVEATCATNVASDGDGSSCSSSAISGSLPNSISLPILQPRSDHKQGCCSASDALDARRAADRLDIPFYALNFEEEFKQIIDYFVDEYSEARTPNPCVMCNNWVKFGKLFEYADSVGAEFVATGHYAQLATAKNQQAWPTLHRGLDDGKDQSYVLFGVKRDMLQRIMLPVGGYRKPEIRALAAEIGLQVAEKKDSQEICFVTSGHHAEFVAERKSNGNTAGEIVTTEGKVVGEHQGFEKFTIGQRKGLGVAMGEPYFVVRIEKETQRVVIGQKQDLARTELTANQTNWLVEFDDQPRRCAAQIRYNSKAVDATIQKLAGDRLQVKFDTFCFGVAPGQAVVCYDGDQVLGGGWIE